MMRKLLPFVAIALMVLIAACSNESSLPETALETAPTLSFSATMPGDDPATRVLLDQKENKTIALKWQAGDKLHFAFVQGETKRKNTITIKAAEISTDGKNVEFNVSIPEGIEAGEYDLYGVYGVDGNDGGLSDANFTNFILPTNPSSMGSLERVQNRGDVMLYFEAKNIDPNNPPTSVTFKHLGSLFSVSFNNITQGNLDFGAQNSITQIRLVGIGSDNDEKWAFNSGEGAQIYDLENGVLLNQETASNSISFLATNSEWIVGQTTTLWGWYPILPNKGWPILQLQLLSSDGTVIRASTNTKPKKATAPTAGKSYYFYATLDANNDLSFVDPFDLTSPAPASN